MSSANSIHDSQEYDAIVIGGGFAGVTATRELVAAGLNTVLMEARDRLGGRTWTVDFDGTTVELGGAWVHWRQPHVWAEMARYQIGVERDDWKFDAALFGQPPQRCDPDAAFSKVNELFARYADSYRDVLPRPYDPLLLMPQVTAVDQLSMQDRLAELGLSEAEEDWLTGLLYEIAGSPLSEAGLLPVLRWMSLCDWSIDGWYETNVYRPRGGTQAILDAMLDDGRAEVRLSAAVDSVSLVNDAVEVRTLDGRITRAGTAVVAIPVNLWPHVQFHPRLPAGHEAAAAVGVGKPHQDKVWIRVRGNVERVFAQLPFPAPLNFFWTYREFDDGQLIIGINASPALDVGDATEVARLIQRYLPEIEEVVDVRAHSWSADKYSRGGNGCHRPGQVTRHLSDLQQPWGPVSFATSDIANGWFGYIDGAIESGLRAAHQCVGAYRSKR